MTHCTGKAIHVNTFLIWHLYRQPWHAVWLSWWECSLFSPVPPRVHHHQDLLSPPEPPKFFSTLVVQWPVGIYFLWGFPLTDLYCIIPYEHGANHALCFVFCLGLLFPYCSEAWATFLVPLLVVLPTPWLLSHCPVEAEHKIVYCTVPSSSSYIYNLSISIV